MRFRSSQSSQQSNPTRRVPLQLRQVRPGVVVVRASNDTVADEYGTSITVEALMRDWLPGFWQHRTISLQHNLPELRGIRGKPFVGRALRVDFAPQLEVEVEVLDPETRRLVEEGTLTGASLEFVPLESRTQRVGDQESEVYYRLSPEPEHAGLTLTDLPAVPGAEILEVRSDLPAPWQFAVVDPAVFQARSFSEEASPPPEIVRVKGFKPVPKRWVVERTFAWMGRSRRLGKDYEYYPEVTEAWLYLGI